MTDDIRENLQLTDAWFALGLVTPTILERLAVEYATGDDPYPEHYRWRLFASFLQKNTLLTAETIKSLYELGNKEPDNTLGTSMMIWLIELRECPPDVLDAASRSGRPALAKKAMQHQLRVKVE